MTKTKKRNIVASLAILLVATIVISATYAYFTSSDQVVNTFTVGDLEIEIDEPEWPYTPENPPELVPGDTVAKDPTITALPDSKDSYMRVIMTLVDTASGDVITDADRIALILKTLYHDIAGDKIDGKTATKDTYTKYSLADIDAWGNTVLNPYNSAIFEADTVRSTAGEYYYIYKGLSATAPYIFNETTNDAVLFTHVVIPTDWTQDDLETLGNYQIVIRAEAIQADNFATFGEAFTALDTQLTPPTP